MKYLSIDLETTGLRDSDHIIEFACVPVDVKNKTIEKELSFHAFLKCPNYKELEPNLSDFVKEHNKSLIETAHSKGLNKEEFVDAFDKYIQKVSSYFENEKPNILGKSLNALDVPFLIRDFGRDEFLSKYFSHRALDVTSSAKTLVDMGLLPEGCSSSRKLAQHFNMGEDVDHTALEDSIDVATMYFKLLELK